MLLKSRASPDMLPFSLCNKKRLAIRHMNRPLFPTTLSIPSYDIGKYVGLRTYQSADVYFTKRNAWSIVWVHGGKPVKCVQYDAILYINSHGTFLCMLSGYSYVHLACVCLSVYLSIQPTAVHTFATFPVCILYMSLCYMVCFSFLICVHPRFKSGNSAGEYEAKQFSVTWRHV